MNLHDKIKDIVTDAVNYELTLFRKRIDELEMELAMVQDLIAMSLDDLKPNGEDQTTTRKKRVTLEERTYWLTCLYKDKMTPEDTIRYSNAKFGTMRETRNLGAHLTQAGYEHHQRFIENNNYQSILSTLPGYYVPSTGLYARDA